MGHFINGLKEDIRKEIQVLQPYNLKQAMDLAIRVEDRDRVEKNVGSGSWSSKSRFHKSGSVGPITNTGPNQYQAKSAISGVDSTQTTVASPHTNTLRSGVRRLTESELQEKRAKGCAFGVTGSGRQIMYVNERS